MLADREHLRGTSDDKTCAHRSPNTIAQDRDPIRRRQPHCVRDLKRGGERLGKDRFIVADSIRHAMQGSAQAPSDSRQGSVSAKDPERGPLRIMGTQRWVRWTSGGSS